MASTDAAVRFEASNAGFSALLVDPRDPKRVYAGVVNDKTFGGVFASSDGGAQ
jgi:hypothetical protein